MISDSILLDIGPIHFLAGQLFNQLNGFQHRRTVITATANVVDLTWPWVLPKSFKRFDNVVTMNLIAHLFAFVTVDVVCPFGPGHLDQERKEPVQLDARVSGTR